LIIWVTITNVYKCFNTYFIMDIRKRTTYYLDRAKQEGFITVLDYNIILGNVKILKGAKNRAILRFKRFLSFHAYYDRDGIKKTQVKLLPNEFHPGCQRGFVNKSIDILYHALNKEIKRTNKIDRHKNKLLRSKKSRIINFLKNIKPLPEHSSGKCELL